MITEQDAGFYWLFSMQLFSKFTPDCLPGADCDVFC